MQYVIIGLSSFALTVPVMWWVLSRRFHRRVAVQRRAYARKRPAQADWQAAAAGGRIAVSRSSGGGWPWVVLAAVIAAVVSGGVAVLGVYAKEAPPTRPDPSASPSTPRPSSSGGLVTGGGDIGGGDDGKPGSGGGRTAGGEGLFPLLSADNLSALGSVVGGIAAAATVCVSVYQMRVSRSASALAAPAAKPPPTEPPPSEGYL